MKLLKFLAEKIVIVEVMLILLNIAMHYFGIVIPLINTLLVLLTPIDIIAFILYIILALLDTEIIKIALGIVLGGIILYYLYKYILV